MYTQLNLVAYFDNEDSFSSAERASMPMSPRESSRGEGVTSTKPSSTPPNSPPHWSPFSIGPSYPLPPYASNKPFTPLPSPPPFENPILNFSSLPLSPEILIPTNTSNPPTPPPTISDDQDINDISLSLLHPTKQRHTGKSLVHPLQYLVVLDSELNEASELVPFDSSPPLQKICLVDLFLDTRLEVHENEVLEFYVNLNVLEGNVATSFVNGVELVFDNVYLVDPKPGPHQLALGNLLTVVFKAFNVPLGEGSIKDMISRSTLTDSRLLDNDNLVPATTHRDTGPVSNLFTDLHTSSEENASLFTKIVTLRTNFVES
ncbi:hypothetical protein KY285_010251 [Solanum tuberosum]|nr:hypothetical protein KY289_010789 [Solanum tuberosum]KAH0734544.1 hypothetical protein KY285_010251 [Solanum tuberosum]